MHQFDPPLPRTVFVANHACMYVFVYARTFMTRRKGRLPTVVSGAMYT